MRFNYRKKKINKLSKKKQLIKVIVKRYVLILDFIIHLFFSLFLCMTDRELASNASKPHTASGVSSSNIQRLPCVGDPK